MATALRSPGAMAPMRQLLIPALGSAPFPSHSHPLFQVEATNMGLKIGYKAKTDRARLDFQWSVQISNKSSHY
jgi:hypothetical protein